MGASLRDESSNSAFAACPKIFLAVLLGALWAIPLATAQSTQQPELATHETAPSFTLKSKREMVLVRVVVKDSQGHPVGNLRKEDFALADAGKPQAISYFSVEVPSRKPPAGDTQSTEKTQAASGGTNESPAVLPQRYLALYFDDIRAEGSDLIRSRDAADRYLEANLQSSDRAGIFTSSGQGIVDFTDDLAKLHAALFELRPRPVGMSRTNDCLRVEHYEAYLIVQQHDSMALDAVTWQALQCLFSNDQRFLQQAQNVAQNEASQQLQDGEFQADYSLRGLRQLVQRMRILPGLRSIVVVSPGFFALDQQSDVYEIIDRALNAGVVIDALDERGLYVPDVADASQTLFVSALSASVTGRKSMMRILSEQRDADVMRDLADATGGTFFENSNDLDAGFRIVGSLPETYYVLGFSPASVKADGRFHSLNVKLLRSEKWRVQARRGYYARKGLPDANEEASREIEEEVFSNDEQNELGVAVHTQFFKPSALEAKLSVLTRVDARALRFRKENGRSVDNLVVITALFDRNGNYLNGQEKKVDMHLRDATLSELMRSGINFKSNFDVQLGTYVVRSVVREGEGSLTSTLNQTVEIPY
jgi:VWFA-related protein